MPSSIAPNAIHNSRVQRADVSVAREADALFSFVPGSREYFDLLAEYLCDVSSDPPEGMLIDIALLGGLKRAAALGIAPMTVAFHLHAYVEFVLGTVDAIYRYSNCVFRSRDDSAWTILDGPILDRRLTHGPFEPHGVHPEPLDRDAGSTALLLKVISHCCSASDMARVSRCLSKATE